MAGIVGKNGGQRFRLVGDGAMIISEQILLIQPMGEQVGITAVVEIHPGEGWKIIGIIRNRPSGIGEMSAAVVVIDANLGLERKRYIKQSIVIVIAPRCRKAIRRQRIRDQGKTAITIVVIQAVVGEVNINGSVLLGRD